MPAPNVSQPGAMAHDLGDNDAMMAVRRAVQPVNRIRGNVQRRGKSEGQIGHGHVVVNRFGQGDDVEAGLGEAQRALLGAAAAQANQGVQSVAFIIFDDDVGHVVDPAINRHAVRLVAAGAQDGAAHGENAGQGGSVELEPPVFHDASETIPEPDDFHAVKSEGGLPHAADGGVQSGTVAAGRQNADAFGLSHGAVKLALCGLLSRKS